VVFLKVFHLLLFFKSFVVEGLKRIPYFKLQFKDGKYLNSREGMGYFSWLKKNKEKVNGGCFIFLFRGFLGLLGHYFVI